jgi:ABC-type dipeptide/oligopeptide/nickel transport system permease component
VGLFLARRFLQLVPVVWGVGTLVFLLLHIVPGDPVEIMLGETALAANKDALRAQLHLDQPLPVQYAVYWKSVLRGDLGSSFISKRPVSVLVAERAPATLKLAFWALIAAVLIAIPLGVLAASFRDGIFDHAVLAYSMLGAAMPNFWLGPLLMLFFSVRLGWLPVTGSEGPSNYVLPAITLGMGMSCVLTRMVRTTMAEVLKQDYVTTARAKGLAWGPIHLKHALKNALIPVITILGLQLGGLLAGAVITETIFDWPGLGELVYRGIQSRDFPLVQGCLLVIAATYVAANTLADIAYKVANPRLESP